MFIVEPSGLCTISGNSMMMPGIAAENIDLILLSNTFLVK
jgi:hypothetical protein